jgi:ribosomal protein S18 acetylase RimI-like enzyme
MIRRATLQDGDWIRDTAAHVYAALGDYGRVIPGWVSHPGVATYVETTDDGLRRGFILLGFYAPWTVSETERSSIHPGELVADLLAIAVAPEQQRQGIGKTLLGYAVDLVREASARAPVRELRLTVADTNLIAQHLFDSFGFEVLDENHGAYDGGQRAIRMRLRIH